MTYKRFLLAALTLLAALVLGLPWWIGKDVERRYRELAAQGGSGTVSVSLESFERGWFASRARLRLGPASPAATGATGRNGGLVLETRVAHGLFPIAASGPGRWQPALAVGEGEFHGGDPGSPDPLASMTYRVRPLGGFELTVDSPSGDRTGAALSWRDGRLHASVPAGAGHGHLELDAARLSVPVHDSRVEMRELSARLDLQFRESGLPTGRAVASSREVTLSTPDGTQRLGRAEAIKADASLSRQGATLAFRASGQLASVASPRATYGPGEMRLSVTGLDAAAAGRLASSAARLGGAGMSRRSLQMAVAGTLLAEAPRLLVHGPSAGLDRLELETPRGNLTGRGRLALDSADPVVLNNPFLLQRAVVGELELKIPPVAARHGALLYLRRHGRLAEWGTPEAWLAQQVARGRLVREGDDYRFRIGLEDGRAWLNGRPLDGLRP